jgi:DNA polymerase-3 subunit beta
MVFEVLQENLASSISVALKFVSPKAQLPILGNFLIEAKSGILKISATDLENSISLVTGAKIEEEGNITVSAKTFSEFVLTLPAGKIEVSNDGEDLVLKSGKFKAKINTMPVAEYPKILGAVDGKKLLGLPPKALHEVADKLSFSVSTDVSRGGMTGVYLDNKEEKLKIVATDGFRLSLLEKAGFKEDFTLNVPAKIIDELGKMAAKEEKEIEVYLNDNKTQAIFKIQDMEISTRLIEGKYPPYEKIVPTGFETQATVDRQEFLRSIKAAGIFSKDVSNVVKLKFSDTALKITASTANLGENESEIDCQKTGNDLEINFNYHYLIDILSRLCAKEVIFESAGETRPGVFREKDSPGFLHIIMPVKKS